MSVRRINRETGVIEERSECVDAISDGEWKPLAMNTAPMSGLTPIRA